MSILFSVWRALLMRLRTRLGWLLRAVVGVLVLGGLSSWAGAQVTGGVLGPSIGSRVSSEQVTAELLAHAPEGVAPGQTVWVGLRLQHAKDWHTYWKNPGDSGLPTELNWQLPPGIEVGEVAWPTPKKFPLGPLANYGYDGTVLLPVALTVTSQWQSSAKLDIQLQANWLVCRTECLPEEGRFQLRIPTQSATALYAAAFESAWQAQPKKVASNDSKSSVEGEFLSIFSADLPAAWQGKPLEVFPETAAIVQPGAPWQQRWDGHTWHARLPLSTDRSASPTRLPVVFAAQHGLAHGEAAAAGVRLELSVSGVWPALPQAGGVSPALQAALDEQAAQATTRTSGGSASAVSPPAPADVAGWLLAVAGALGGGLILNLMPCVFPVLAIKVLAFTQHSGQDPAQERRAHRMAGVAYTVGVVLSFVALGGVLVGLRAAGEQLGWGFQLQSPGVVAALAVLFTVIGLNLAGVFEFGSMLPSAVASVQVKHPAVDAFLTGVLATAVASPCTAPFMGASLGFAVGLPAVQALSVFAAIGVGMALPYLAASWWPAVAHALPRPGAWMNTFKQAMAFPMFATVVWLVWVLGQQTGMNGAAALLLLLVALAGLMWAGSQTGRSRRWLVGGTALGLALLLWRMGPLVLMELPVASAPTEQAHNATAGPAQGSSGPTWAPWSPERMARLQHDQQPVFVDFTAAWCVTCQFNKQSALADPELLADFAQRQVTLLRADWTRRDPAITQALAAVGRSGIPTYVLYRPGKPPLVLSEVLSVGDVRAALAQL
jgi:thiol:disulfide interchange protein DsbD